MIPAMRVRDHSKIIWPPLPGGTRPEREQSYSESAVILRKVHASFTDKSVPLTCEFKGNGHDYDIMLKDGADHAFAERLTAAFSSHAGDTVKQFGDLEIDF